MHRINTKTSFSDEIKNLKKLQPFEPCPKCNSKLLFTIEVEPINKDYFTNEETQKCIIECSDCKSQYVSKYDS